MTRQASQDGLLPLGMGTCTPETATGHTAPRTRLVVWRCPTCPATVTASPRATVTHLCPRTPHPHRQTTFTPEENP